MSGLNGRTDGLPQGGSYNHHLAGAGEFSTGEMGNFQPALTREGICACACVCCRFGLCTI